MKVLIIAHFSGDFCKTDNVRFKYIADLLSSNNKIEIITSKFDHGTKKERKHLSENLPYKVTFLHEPGYSKNVCLKRFYSHFKWGLQVRKYLKSIDKPDVVYCAVPSLTGPYFAAKYCEKNNIKFIIDVQDLWPEAFKMVFNIPILSSLIFYPFKFLANGIYKRADAICAVSDTYCQRAAKVNKKVKDTTTVYLGTELETFDRYAAENPVLEKKEGEIWLAYCGTLGSSYDLTCVIDALAKLDGEKIRFIVMGDGPKKEEFESYAKSNGVNATFTGRLTYNVMCSLLNACDITVNPITHMAAQSIINKHADYAASGLPVVSTQESEEYRKLIEQYRMGFNCRNNDSEDLAEKIKRLIDDKDLRQEMGANARKCAEERFDRAKCYKLLSNQILTNRGGMLSD